MRRKFYSHSILKLALFVLIISFHVILCVDDEIFFEAARSGDTEILEYFVNKGKPVNSCDNRGNSALVIASGRGQLAAMTLLIQNGAFVEDVTQLGLFEGKSALCWASSQGRAQAVGLLLQAGADPNRQPERGVFQGKTALMWASSQGRVSAIRILLSSGVDVNFVSKTGNFQGKSSLMWASSQGRVDAVRALLQAGANVNAADVDGVTALMWACGSEAAEEAHQRGLQFLEKATKGQKDVVQLLLEYGARIDDRDNDGITAIMYASYHGHASAIEVLLNWGADADVQNKAGQTAYQLALNAGFEDAAGVIERGPIILNLTGSELKYVSSCGWLLSVLRAPRGTGIYPSRPTACSSLSDGPCAPTPHYTVASSCSALRRNGLDDTLHDLLYLAQHGPGIDDLISYLGLETYASKTRAKIQLAVLLKKNFDSNVEDNKLL